MSKPQMTLGEFIRALERKEPADQVKFDFVHFGPTTFASYRGYYEQLALGYEECGRMHRNAQYEYPTVEVLLKQARMAIGQTFTGWKGGDYVMDERTRLWVANPGESGSTAIVDVRDMLYVTIVTEMADD